MATRVAEVRSMTGAVAQEAILSVAADRVRAPVFETRPWLTAWWDSFGRDEQTVALVADEGDSRWILPLYVDAGDHEPTVRWLGYPFVDRATVLGDRSTLSWPAAARLAEALMSLGMPVELDALDPDHESTARLLHTLEASGWAITDEACPMLALGDRVDRSRKNLTRFGRRFPAARMLLMSGPALTRSVVSEFVQCRQQRWQADGRWHELPPVEHRPEFVDLFGSLIEVLALQGSARLLRLEVDGVVLAQDLHLGVPTMPLLYFRTYDRAYAAHSPGRALLDQYVVWAAGAGCEAVDLGRGAEQYKYDLGGDTSNVAEAIWRP